MKLFHFYWLQFFRNYVGRKFETSLSEEGEVNLEIIWKHGLHSQPYYVDSEDDDNGEETREITIKETHQIMLIHFKDRTIHNLFSSKERVKTKYNKMQM